MNTGTILIVDDNKGVLASLELLLENYFSKILTASNPNKSGKTKRATLQKRRVSKSTKTTRTRKTVSPVLSCMTKAHRFLFV